MEITDRTFDQEVLTPNSPALVMFWGSWCPVCKRMEPMLEELKGETKEKVKICKINIDRNPRKTAEYNIMGTPTFYLFIRGKAQDMVFGAQSKKQLLEFINCSL